MPNDTALYRRYHLTAQPYELSFEPEAGGLVSALRCTVAGRTHDILRAPAGAVASTLAPNRFGLWPLVPFANRAFGAVVDDGESRFATPVNDPETGSTIHGFGWQVPWSVTEFGPERIVMEHERRDGPDPYRYRARFSVEATSRAVIFRLGVTSRAATALPFGIGLHPWFVADAHTRFQANTGGALRLGPGYRPVGRFQFDDGGPFTDPVVLDPDRETAWSFTDWDGAAMLLDPTRGLRIVVTASPTLRQPVLWAPPAADFLCFEPQSHGIGAPSDAAGRAATPLVRLEPGQSMIGSMRISVLPM